MFNIFHTTKDQTQERLRFLHCILVSVQSIVMRVRKQKELEMSLDFTFFYFKAQIKITKKLILVSSCYVCLNLPKYIMQIKAIFIEVKDLIEVFDWKCFTPTFYFQRTTKIHHNTSRGFCFWQILAKILRFTVCANTTSGKWIQLGFWPNHDKNSASKIWLHFCFSSNWFTHKLYCFC